MLENHQTYTNSYCATVDFDIKYGIKKVIDIAKRGFPKKIRDELFVDAEWKNAVLDDLFDKLTSFAETLNPEDFRLTDQAQDWRETNYEIGLQEYRQSSTVANAIKFCLHHSLKNVVCIGDEVLINNYELFDQENAALDMVIDFYEMNQPALNEKFPDAVVSSTAPG